MPQNVERSFWAEFNTSIPIQMTSEFDYNPLTNVEVI